MGRYLVAAALAATMMFAQDFRLGSKVGDFTLRDAAGQPVDFQTLRGTVTVVTFVSVQCPVSNSYNDRMNALYREYSPRGVKFVFVNANHTESLQDVARHAKEHFAFAVYKDEDNRVADEFGASVTPEAFVIDSSGVIRYHGSVDDSMQVGHVTDQRLKKALDAVLAGQQPPEPETKAFGCSIKRVKKAS